MLLSRLAIVMILVGCAHAPVVRPTPTEDEITRLSHAWYAALDGHDVAAIRAYLGESYLAFEEARTWDGKVVLERAAQRGDRPASTRAWKSGVVTRGPGSAVFVGEAHEVMPQREGPAQEFDGWNTLVWAYDGGAWRVVHQTWQKGGVAAERDSWNDIFRRDSQHFEHAPNKLLVSTVAGRAPGNALDVLCGQGRNGLYLATQGWKVTGVDISDEGLRRAREVAERDHLPFTAVEADASTWDFGENKWDLVAMIYAGDDVPLVEKSMRAVAPGGLFVLEYFHLDGRAGTTGTGGYRTGQLAKLFANWKIVRDEVVEDVADWGREKTKLVRFVAEKPRS